MKHILKQKNHIGRPKTFDKNEVLKLAMLHFWEHGYDNTSLDDLLMAMGIKKSSFYSTFKSKEEIFSLTLDVYRQETFSFLKNLKNEVGAKETLLTLANSIIKELKDTGKVKGCLMMNSSKECYGKYPDLSHQIALDFNTFSDFFATIIEEAKNKKEILNSLSAQVITGRFLSISNGLVIMIQAGASKEVIDDILLSINELLE